MITGLLPLCAAQVVAHERSELQQQAEELCLQLIGYNITLTQLEDNLLARLAASKVSSDALYVGAHLNIVCLMPNFASDINTNAHWLVQSSQPLMHANIGWHSGRPPFDWKSWGDEVHSNIHREQDHRSQRNRGEFVGFFCFVFFWMATLSKALQLSKLRGSFLDSSRTLPLRLVISSFVLVC